MVDPFDKELFDLYESLRELNEQHRRKSKKISKSISIMQDGCEHPRKYHQIQTGDGSMVCTRCKKWIR